MRLSIIIPVFNAGQYLVPLLASLRVFAAEDIEFIAVDDGSTDQSLQTLLEHATTDARLRVIQQANSGVAVARNRGLAGAKGEYIWFVDADDLVVPTAFESLLRATTSEPDVIAFNGERFSEVGGGAGAGADVAARGSINRERIYQADKSNAVVSGEQWLSTLLKQKELRHFVWLHWCRRDYLQTIGLTFLPDTMHEDVAWATEVTLRAKRVQYVDVVGYEYRHNPASATGSSDDHQLMRRIHSYFTVVGQLQVLNKTAMQPTTLNLLRGEVVGQALQIFELAKQLQSKTNHQQVVNKCRAHRFAQGLWHDALNFKRKRQVAAMWLRQQFG